MVCDLPEIPLAQDARHRQANGVVAMLRPRSLCAYLDPDNPQESNNQLCRLSGSWCAPAPTESGPR